MKWLPGGPSRSVRSQLAIVLTLALIASVTAIVPALASHPEASLSGSNFEIDEDANLKLDDAAPSVDWATLAHPNGPELRATDLPTGQNDDSYKGGVKEDTACPDETTGSIPNNKSDLLTFHVNEEAGPAGHPGFLNLAWSRVSDPSGTTLMDFEFNQSNTDCAVGPNKVRTEGDLLIEYAIVQGGARAELTARTWNGTAWGSPVDIDADNAKCPDPSDPSDTAGPCAVGTINQNPIPAGMSDGLISTGEKAARTFGEAQIDLRLIFDSQSCTTFGSAMLKSRSSDAFNSQLKDFIAPIGISLTNCGTVIIRKQTNPEEGPNVTDFGYTKAFATDPSSANTFTLKDDGVKTFSNVLFGTGYTVSEDVIPSGWALQTLDCSSSTGVSPNTNGATVTFAIDDADDVLDCTYTNQLQVGAIKVTKTRKHAASGSGDHPHAGVDFTVDGVTKATNASGVACFDGLAFGSYNVVETVPSGYVADGATTKSVTVDNVADCDDDPYGGESVSFSNTPLTNLTVSVDSQVNGGTASTIECKLGTTVVASGSTGANGDGSATASNLVPGTYVCTVVIDP